MQEFLYAVDSVWIALGLFLSMTLAIEMGYRLGHRVQKGATDSFKVHVNAISASLLGILALMLGFTFSLSVQRFDRRSEAVVNEANAIGTAYLRSQLLPVALRNDVQKLLRDYVQLRIQASTTTLLDQVGQAVLLAQASQRQNVLWAYARQAADADPNPVSTGLFVQSVNELIDNFGTGNAELTRHVPEVVLLLLYATFLMAGSVIGYSAGVAGHRMSFVTYVMVLLVVVLVFIIIDLDRPRRGLIEVSQQSLIELRTAINADLNGKAK